MPDSAPDSAPTSASIPASIALPTSLTTSAIVFLHGQPGAGSDWDAVVAALPAGLRTLAPDRPGYRSNPHPAGSFDDNAWWLLSELDRAGLREVVIVGHSYGGAVALAVAAVAPERVRGLVLVASVGPECLDGWDAILAAPVLGAICAVSAWWLTPWLARRRLGRLRRRHPAVEYVNLDAWGNARHDNGTMWRTFLTEQRALVGHLDTLDSRLESTGVRAVIVADPADKMVPLATARALAAKLPNAELRLVGGGGHHLPRRNPEAVAREVSRFIDSLD